MPPHQIRADRLLKRSVIPENGRALIWEMLGGGGGRGVLLGAALFFWPSTSAGSFLAVTALIPWQAAGAPWCSSTRAT